MRWLPRPHTALKLDPSPHLNQLVKLSDILVMAHIKEKDVIEGVAECVDWWIKTRRSKLVDQLSESMSVNPFLAPFLYQFHSANNFENLVELLVAGHMMVGHATGFGKLVDEKILPKVFKTIKLDKSYRKKTRPYNQHIYDEIDHLIPDNKKTKLLSLKASKWTIQLTMAVQLNAAFRGIILSRKNEKLEIVVGVLYGLPHDLTDKYDILRGINRGADHNVVDLRNYVTVVSGSKFWAYLNDNEKTQEWVLAGILKAINNNKEIKDCSTLFKAYKSKVKDNYKEYISENENINWQGILKKING